MTRFFVLPEEMTGDFLVLTGENAEHAKVLRLKNGENVPNICAHDCARYRMCDKSDGDVP